MKPILALLLFAVSAYAQVKRPTPPPVKPSFTSSLQAVVVTANEWDSVTGKAQLFERKNSGAAWKAVGDSFPVVIGRSGLAWGDQERGAPGAVKIKKEGDGNAPAGLFPLTAAFGSSTKPNAVELPYTKLDKYTECVDDVKSNFYNRIVNRMQVGNFDWKSSEKMLAEGAQYDLGVFVSYNSYPVEKGNGSCIFLHVWKAADAATSGCTAMDRHDLERVVAWLSPAKTPYLIQLPASEHKRFRKTWNLPKMK